MLRKRLDLFPEMISNGEFDRVLVRPRVSYFRYWRQRLNFSRLGRLIQAAIVFTYAIPASGVIWTWDKILTLVLMVVCGALIFFGLFLVYAGFTFYN